MNEVFFLINRNLRFFLGAIVVAIVIILFIVLAISKNNSTQKIKVTVSNKTFNVYLAKSEIEKQVGLSSKNKISNSEGMLFSFDKPDFYSFWMKEMKFPIDIIYISNDKVVTVISNIKPPADSEQLTTYQPKTKSDMVLEINAGLAEKYNIQVGSTVKIRNL